LHKITLTAIAAVILAGCASKPDVTLNNSNMGSTLNAYTYDSKAHSGTVTVTDRVFTNSELNCASDWREGEVITPKGIPSMGRDHLKLSIKIESDDGSDNSYELLVPQYLGYRVLAKDFQERKEYMLGAETSGVVQQGSHFEFPSGYYIRVSQPGVVDQDKFQSCIGIDRMYVLTDDLRASTNPPVYLDRVVVPFSLDQAHQPVKVQFGFMNKLSAEIRVLPE